MPANSLALSSWRDSGMPDPAVDPALFRGVLWRRAAAYVIDLCCIGLIAAAAWIACVVLTVLSFGLLGPGLWVLFGLIPLAYHTLLVGGPLSATLGMRAFGLQMHAVAGNRPSLLQALVHAVLFYLTVGATCALILLFALINRRKRTLHDVLSGVLMVRAPGRAAATEVRNI